MVLSTLFSILAVRSFSLIFFLAFLKNYLLTPFGLVALSLDIVGKDSSLLVFSNSSSREIMGFGSV